MTVVAVSIAVLPAGPIGYRPDARDRAGLRHLHVAAAASGFPDCPTLRSALLPSFLHLQLDSFASKTVRTREGTMAGFSACTHETRLWARLGLGPLSRGGAHQWVWLPNPCCCIRDGGRSGGTYEDTGQEKGTI